MRSTEINCHLYSSSNNSPKLQIQCINFVWEAYTFSEIFSVFYKKTSILPWGTVIFFIYHKIKNFKKQYLQRISFYVTSHWAILSDVPPTARLRHWVAENYRWPKIPESALLIFTLKQQITPKSRKICWSCDRCLWLENICHGFLMLHRRRMTSACKYGMLEKSIVVSEVKC